MYRRLRFTTLYLSDARRLGGGTQASLDVAKMLRAMCADLVLPGPHDAQTLMPLTEGPATAVRTLAHVRRVSKRNLWLWYRVRGDELELLAMTDEPPPRQT